MINRSGIITLTTDFGYSDPFVGQMKGAILSIHPHTIIVDLTHDIPSHDIEGAGFVLASSYAFFPEGTIHIAVVDPGVGSDRKGIIISSRNHFFIGPDNGIFSGIVTDNGSYHAIQITNAQFMLPVKGPTFHGRDIFAPAASWLARGTEMAEFGSAVEDLFLLDFPKPEIHETGVSGQIVYIDKFGNAITNIRKNSIDVGEAGVYLLRREKDMIAVSFAPNYADARSRRLHALFNSSGYLELFVNRKSAASLHGIRKGDKVLISLSPFHDNPLSGD